MMRNYVGRATMFAALSLGGFALLFPVWADEPKPAPIDELFTGGKVRELSIDIGAKEMESLRREPKKYVKATLKEGDKVYADVGLHLKGAAGSFRGIDDKPGLTLNMDKFVEDQKFHGMDKFHLANSVQDPSYVSELICGELYRAAGVPAARVTHAVVTINGKRKGLYYLKEGYDREFLKRAFKGNKGNFYDGGFLRDVDQPLQLLSTKSDVKDHADLKALTKAAREGDVKQRFAKLEKVLDMDRFITYLALQSITWDWDGYPMNRNNYRIYHDPERDKLIFLPSGMDQMFANPEGPLVPNFQGLVARALMETPEGKDRFKARVGEILKKSYDLDAIDKRLDGLQEKVQPALAANDANAGRDYPNHIKRLKDHMRRRARSLEKQLEAK